MRVSYFEANIFLRKIVVIFGQGLFSLKPALPRAGGLDYAALRHSYWR
jgi:hypothetical protein